MTAHTLSHPSSPLPPSNPPSPPGTPPIHVNSSTSTGFELLSAVAAGDNETVRSLLNSRTNRQDRQAFANFSTCDGRRPLHIACAAGHETIAKQLVNAGADWRARDRFGISCVKDAVRNGRFNVLRVFAQLPGISLPAKIQLTDTDYRYTVGRDLICCAAQGNIKAVTQLIRSFQANVNFQNSDGRTPLHVAAVRGQMEMVRLLLEYGADAHKRDRFGVSAAEEIRRYGNEEDAKLVTQVSQTQSKVVFSRDDMENISTNSNNNDNGGSTLRVMVVNS